MMGFCEPGPLTSHPQRSHHQPTRQLGIADPVFRIRRRPCTPSTWFFGGKTFSRQGCWDIGTGLNPRATLRVARNCYTGEGAVTKASSIISQTSNFRVESTVYDILYTYAPTIGIAQPQLVKVSLFRRVFVLPHLGPSLDDCFQSHGRFSAPKVLLVGLQALARLRTIHELGIIHRAIKPRHFVFGSTPMDRGVLYLVDFSNARMYDSNL